ncbi:MAG TPA: FMN-binding protein [Saprospiraceae bacterium]|nr:FMN-binding protein [Saprospiraceae bacterium]
MIQQLIVFLSLTMAIGGSEFYPWSAVLEQKVDKAIKSTYQVEDYSLRSMDVQGRLTSTLPSEMENSLFELVEKDQLLGYVYVAQAPSMKNVFDYVVLFEKDLTVRNAKVLIYREQHGRQIGSRRWLSQFLGMGPEDRPELGAPIDGISGATISVTNMTKAMKDLLASVHTLDEKGLFE